jgi:hypothetical protein
MVIPDMLEEFSYEGNLKQLLVGQGVPDTAWLAVH